MSVIFLCSLSERETPVTEYTNCCVLQLSTLNFSSPPQDYDLFFFFFNGRGIYVWNVTVNKRRRLRVAKWSEPSPRLPEGFAAFV